ncbi:hypothetical protein, partial [Mucilaginibacter terrenus]|uniref:hypothetical protein n=1 Tax=Mucilaginibacter terrenus TaxID=2482727 RepID=UPI00197C7C16
LLLQHLLHVEGGQFVPESPGQFAPELVVSLPRNQVVSFIRISSIVSKKVNFLMGDGIVTKGDTKAFKADLNPVDTAEELIQKLVYDYVVFNYFAIEVQYDLLNNKPLYFNHIPANQLRSNKSKTKFWVCDDWQAKKNLLTYDRWVKGKNEDRKSKVFFYSGYVPSVSTVYPNVDYSGAITAMVTDILINNFNKNNIEDGFSPAHIINFFKGVPTAEDAKAFERKFAETYKGVDGLKYLLSWNNADGKAPEINTIAGDDYATKLIEVVKKIENAILQSHSATRLLFGVETEGSLGGNGAELEIQFEIFKQTWVKNTRNVIESGLNKLFADAGLPAIEFKDKTTLFSASLESATREKVLTIDELRAIDGKPVLPNGEGAKLLTAAAPVQAPAFNQNRFSATGKMLTDADFELVKDLGTHKADFDFVENEFSKFADDQIDNYLITEKIDGKSLEQIKADIKSKLDTLISVDDLTKRLNKLTEAKIIKSDITDSKVNIKPVEAPKQGNEVQVMYEYKVRPGYGEPLIDTSRGFCVKLINNDRLYSRADIQTMSSIFGYDVYAHCGGWYTDPATGKAENQCRHQWSKVRVIRKGGVQ